MKSRLTFTNYFDAMKRFLLPGLCLLALTLGRLASAQSSTFYWSETSIPPVPPQIDATNFVNTGAFNVSVPADLITASSLYYDFSSVLNYTNTGSMSANAGFIFDFEPSYFVPPKPHVPFNKMSANFVNQRNGFTGGVIACSAFSTNVLLTGFSLSGSAKFIATATNIINSGSIVLDNSLLNTIIFGIGNAFNSTPVSSLISLTGDNIDLRDGELAFTSSNTTSNLFGVSSIGVASVDYGVGTDTNRDWIPSIDLGQSFAFSSFFQTIRGSAFFLDLTNSIPYSFTVPGGPSNIITRSVFLQDTSDGNVTRNVFFGGSGVGAGAAHIEWSAPFIDPETGVLMTNYLYLSDLYVAVTTNTFVFNGVPQNYSFTQATSPQFGLGNPEVPNLPVFNFGVVSNLYSYLDADLVATVSGTNSIVPGGSITNLPQRIQITASRTLNLDGARISGPDYMSLTSTNQYEGNVGASVSVPYSDLRLGVTNGFLTISNLMRPTLPRWSGKIQAFTARWFDVDINGRTNDNRVLLVNSRVFPFTTPQIQDLILHATNSLIVSDPLNVMRTLSIDATSLTIATNGPGAFSPVGQLNFLNPAIVWSGTMPRLKHLTNSGVITAPNFMFFAGNMSTPYSDPNLSTPYEVFINHGAVTNQGSYIRANYFVNNGVFQCRNNGNFTLIANCAFLTNGTISAPTGAGDVSITANNLVISNQVLQAGGRLTLAAADCFSDGFSLFNMFGHVVTTNTPPFGIVSNGNFLALSGNFAMTVKPATGDLLGTTISNAAAPFANVITTWAGKDRGAAPTGYVNNLAVGRLILNGSAGSKFSFTGVGAGNALYVDRLELYGTATNLGASLQTNLFIAPNFKIYYAQALANGESVAEKLSGARGGINGGHFYWVSNYAGIFSSTNITYFPGAITRTFNQALVESCNINSRQGTGSPDDDGFPNCSTPTHRPIPANWVFDNAVTNTPCACDATQTGSGLGGALHSGHPGGSDSTILPFPGQLNPAGTASNLFTLTQGTYNGLFYETNGVATTSAGYFKATLTKSGMLTGNLRLAGKSYTFSRPFNTGGHLIITNLKSGLNSAWLNLDAQLDLSGGGKINGTVTSSNWTAVLLADRLAPNAIHGKFSFVIPGDDVDSADSPAGYGYGTLGIKSDGTLQWSGMLGDGTSISNQFSGVSSQGVWPLYYAPYSGAGLLLGWIRFDTNQPGSDLSGETIWIKPGGLIGKNALLYPAGFTNQIEVVGSSYVQPPVTSSNGSVVLSGGNLSQPETNSFVLKPNFTVPKQGANQFNLSITKSNGVFQGGEITTFNPKTKLQGVMLQKMGAGYGFFLGTNRSGQVMYVPLP